MRKFSFFPTALLSILLLALTVVSSVQAGNQLETITQIAPISDFQFVSETHGWVLAGNQLWWSENGGSSWREVTPPVDGQLWTASFIDEQHGFAVLSSIDELFTTYIYLASTDDSGNNWQTEEITRIPIENPDNALEAAYLYFLDQDTGWVVLKRLTGRNFSVGTIWGTKDGGNSWQSSTMPIGAAVYFVDSTLGFTAGGVQGQDLYRTIDSGLTWENVHPGGEIRTLLPNFSSPARGDLVGFSLENNSTQIHIYHSFDQGGSWLESANQPIEENASTTFPASYLNDEITIFTPQSTYTYQVGAYTLDSAITDGSIIGQVNMVTALNGFALAYDITCPDEQPEECSQTIQLAKTSDGGQTWTAVDSPDVWEEHTVYTPTFKYLQDAIILAPGTSHLEGQGIDLCNSTVNQLKTWKNKSPYTAVNMYIGGISMGCENNDLSKSYLEDLSIQGWKFIPTWVGPQAACTTLNHPMTDESDAAARAEGIVEAQLAYAKLNELGLLDPTSKTGSVVYYDLEAFTISDIECRNLARSFIDGWVAQLEAYGVTAGLYGSVCASGLSYFSTIPNPPQALWAAWYIEDTYNSAINPYDLICVSNSLWPDNERILQYTGSHNEYWGGVTLNVDTNVIDGIVADISQYVGVPEDATLQNPGFETGALTPWQISTTPSACTASIVNNGDNAHTGNDYLAIKKSSAQTDCLGVVQPLPITPSAGEKYRFAIWARASSAQNRSLRLTIRGTGGTAESATLPFSGITQDWVCLEVDHTIAYSNHSGVQVEVKIDDDDGIDVYLDDGHLSVNTGSLCAMPIPPTHLSASDQTYLDKVKLTWDLAPGATYYKIYRQPISGTEEFVGRAYTNQYDDTTTDKGVIYTYWVQACNALGCSINSNTDTGSQALHSFSFFDGFESGDVSAWYQAVNPENFSVCSQGSIQENYGLCLPIANGEKKYVTEGLQAKTNALTIQFYIDPNDIVLGSSEVVIFQAGSPSADRIPLLVKLGKLNGSYYLIANEMNDNGNWGATQKHTIPNGPTKVKIMWNSSPVQSRSLTSLGGFALYINDVLVQEVRNVANKSILMDEVHFGLYTAPSGTVAGTLYLDDFYYSGPLYLRPEN